MAVSEKGITEDPCFPFIILSRTQSYRSRSLVFNVTWNSFWKQFIVLETSGFSPWRFNMSPNCAWVWALCTNCAGSVWVCVSCPTSLLLPLAPSSSSLVETGSSYTAQADLDLGFSCLNIPSARVTAVLHPPCPATGVFSITNQSLLFQERVFNLLFLNSFYPSWHLMSSI